MNERIAQLAEQSGLEFDDSGVLEFGECIYYITKDDMEKFAKSIIQECCSAANDWYQHHNEIHWDPAQHIRNYFGVEE